jgi:hypothetical protein
MSLSREPYGREGVSLQVRLGYIPTSSIRLVVAKDCVLVTWFKLRARW